MQRFVRGILFLLAALALFHSSAWTQAVVAGQGPVPLIEGAWPAAGDQFSFAILGDKTSGGEGKWPIFDRAVDAINALSPDFVITVGDQIPGHMQEHTQWNAEWAEYLEHAKRLRAPLFLIPGNHDIANTECYAFWKQDFGRTYYAFDYAGCHFLVLNSEEERFDGRGPIWEAMMTFMEEDLAAHRDARHTFLFFHKPMWDDPRFQGDWARIERALGARRYTAVAGHEHYLATQEKDGNLRVIQSATGGGIRLSDVTEFGCFHSFAWVVVEGSDAQYTVIRDQGGFLPATAAPLSFRKAVSFGLAELDALPPEGIGTDRLRLHTLVRFHNVLSERITLRAALGPLDRCGWSAHPAGDTAWSLDEKAAILEVPLRPGETRVYPIDFEVPAERLPYPPRLSYEVEYQGAWLEKEHFPMEELDTVPVYPRSTYQAVPQWQVAGPFEIGDIDTSALPEDPAKASPGFYRAFGPEEGLHWKGEPGWKSCTSDSNGLINMNAITGTVDHALAYVLCGVYSPKDQWVHAAVYADNFSQVLLNGELVEAAQGFGAPGGFVYVPLPLKAGWNTVTAKLFNNRGDWFLRFLIADPAGNLTFSDRPE